MLRKLLPIALLLFVFATKTQAQKQMRVVAVAAYNCENFFDTIHDTLKKDEEFTPEGTYHYTEEVYHQKLHNIATVIGNLANDVTPDGPALIALEEIENDKVLTDLETQPELSSRHYKHVWFYTPDERGISTAMLYNPRYFKLIQTTPIRVPLETVGQKRPTRYILYITGVLAGDTVHVLVNHWPSKTGGAAATDPHRKVAAGIDKHIVDSLTGKNPNSKIIVMGDFNANPDESPISKVLHPVSDKKEADLTDLYDPFAKLYKDGKGTESYQGEWNMIDQIMVSGAFLKNPNHKWQYHDCEIFVRSYLTYSIGYNKGLPHRSFKISKEWDNGYSDHFPVIVYLVEK